MGFGTEKGLDVFFGWGKECITQITNVALFSCPTARKTSRNWYTAQNAQVTVRSYDTRFRRCAFGLIHSLKKY